MTFENSNKLLERELKCAPLGAQTFSKSYRYYMPNSAPLYIDHANGARLYDVDGNEFIDFMCSLGPITLGYNYPAVNEAVTLQLEKGIIFSTQSPLECELAEKLVEVIPCAEMVKLVKNGSDATTAAIRLSRAYTGRKRVAMCGYHGMHDWSIGASNNNKGIPEEVCALTKTYKYNDISSLENLLKEHPTEYAAVILEPIQGNGTTKEYLQAVIDTAHKYGAIGIFDEVVSGFRYAIGGASEYYGVTPDMASYGKGCANGMPLSFVAGKRELISLIEQGVFVSMTFGGEALSMAATLATINIIGEILWCASSIANNIPERGAPVATAKPAHAPPVIEYLLQTGCFFAKTLTLPLPTAVPINTEGPSFPNGTPIKKEVNDIKNTPINVLNHLKVTIPRSNAMDEGIPPPLTLGCFLYMYAKKMARK